MIIIYDANGMRWTVKNHRVYCIEAEEELKAQGESTKENGYFCNNWNDAVRIINDYGYMEK